MVTRREAALVFIANISSQIFHLVSLIAGQFALRLNLGDQKSAAKMGRDMWVVHNKRGHKKIFTTLG